MQIPQALAEEWKHEPGWLAALPRLAAECSEAWDLRLETQIDTPHSLVIPAGEAVLKLNAPSHFEADHEAEALGRWHGVGAVRLLARDDLRRALLCERCRPGTQLSAGGVDEVAVVAELLPRLAHEPRTPHPFRLVADEARRWAEEVPERYDSVGCPSSARSSGSLSMSSEVPIRKLRTSSIKTYTAATFSEPSVNRGSSSTRSRSSASARSTARRTPAKYDLASRRTAVARRPAGLGTRSRCLARMGRRACTCVVAGTNVPVGHSGRSTLPELSALGSRECAQGA